MLINLDILLFWCLAISAKGLKEIRESFKDKLFLSFNFDEPHVNINTYRLINLN